MQFIVNLSIAVDETESPEAALEAAKAGKGKTVSFTVNPRPVQPVRPNPMQPGGMTMVSRQPNPIPPV